MQVIWQILLLAAAIGLLYVGYLCLEVQTLVSNFEHQDRRSSRTVNSITCKTEERLN